MTNPEHSRPNPYQNALDHEHEILAMIHRQIEVEGLDASRRETELDPVEVERRIKIVKEYLGLILETTPGLDEKEYLERRAPGIPPKDQRVRATEQLVSEAYRLGLTEAEVYALSDDPTWQRSAFRGDIRSEHELIPGKNSK